MDLRWLLVCTDNRVLPAHVARLLPQECNVAWCYIGGSAGLLGYVDDLQTSPKDGEALHVVAWESSKHSIARSQAVRMTLPHDGDDDKQDDTDS